MDQEEHQFHLALFQEKKYILSHSQRENSCDNGNLENLNQGDTGKDFIGHFKNISGIQMPSINHYNMIISKDIYLSVYYVMLKFNTYSKYIRN